MRERLVYATQGESEARYVRAATLDASMVRHMRFFPSSHFMLALRRGEAQDRVDEMRPLSCHTILLQYHARLLL